MQFVQLGEGRLNLKTKCELENLENETVGCSTRTALLSPLPASGVSKFRHSHINRGRKCMTGVLSGLQTRAVQ